MAKSRSKNKNRIIEFVILAFVVVSVSLLLVQIGLNVSDTLDQEDTGDGYIEEEIVSTATPAGPTPTIDFSAPISESDF